jgi:hypothetical protein
MVRKVFESMFLIYEQFKNMAAVINMMKLFLLQLRKIFYKVIQTSNNNVKPVFNTLGFRNVRFKSVTLIIRTPVEFLLITSELSETVLEKLIFSRRSR